MKNKFSTIIILIITFILAGVAIFTAIRLYQLRTQPVAPNVPSSKPKAQEAPVNTCSLSFTLATSTATATATSTATSTATATSTSTSTATATSTSTATAKATPNSCGGTCGSNANCQNSLICVIANGATSGFCRNQACQSETDCVCNGTPAPTASQPSLPNSGTEWPTLFGMGLGILVIIGSLLLAL